MGSFRKVRRGWHTTLALLLTGLLVAAPALAGTPAEETLPERDSRLIAAMLEAMPAQQPGKPDLYVVGFAGDGNEDVFRNEVLYLEQLMNARFQADGRVIGLVNHPDSLDEDAPRPLATLENLDQALAGVGTAMDPEEDLLLLFITTHGSEEHELIVDLPPLLEEEITADQLAETLASSGIRNRVVVVSACFSGGFLPALRSPTGVTITAARKDRTSFGCGATSQVTYFGQAWLVDALNHHDDFIAAFRDARKRVAARETEGDYTPSLPQIHMGTRIEPVLDAWRESFEAGPAVAYPYEAADDP